MNPATSICRRCCSRTRRIPSTQQPPTIRSIYTPASRPAKKTQQQTHSSARQASTQFSPSSAQTQEPYITSLGHASPDTSRALLKPNNLYHPFSRSPSKDIRLRAAYMRQHAFCSHPSHYRTRTANGPHDPESRKPLPGDPSSTPANMEPRAPAHVDFECPDCGIPVSCSEEHWMDDYESHLEVCETLRQINEDDHDLRSGRLFPEFDYPGPQRAEEFVLNMANWDTFLYTRDFNAVDDERAMRQVTRLLTYPITIASVLHELSPYNHRKGGRLTNEGLRSFSALRYSLHPPLQGGDETVAGLRPQPPPIRIFVLGARAESSLPREVWVQLTECFPRAKFHVILIGPESMSGRDREFPLPPRTPRNPFGAIIEDRLGGSMKISTYVEYWHTLHAAGEFGVLDPYFDVFFCFHPGLGHPASSAEWEGTLQGLLETKCPVICTGYTEWDMERDRRWVVEKTNGGPESLNRTAMARLPESGDGGEKRKGEEDQDEAAKAAAESRREKGEMDILLEPGENIFRSLRWDLNDLDPNDVSCGNWGVWAFRGKRYEAQTVKGS